jgi:hypothetical protein
MKSFKFFASILLMLCLNVFCYAQTKIDWKQIKNIPDTLEFKNVLLEHLLFKSAYQPVMESVHQGAIYYDNMLEKLRVYENGNWRDLSVTIASDSIGAPLTILGYLQATDVYASQSVYVGKDAIIKGKLNASGPAVLESLKINKTFKVPVTASTTLGVGSMYYDASTGKLNVLNGSNQWEAVGSDIVIDSAMSSTSTNAVQNKVIKSYVDTNTVSAVAQGSNNGTIAVTKNGITSNVSVKGLGTAAYTASTDYATANHNHDSSYVSSVSEGTANGTISVTKNGNTSSVAVHGLGGAAYTNVDSAMDSVSTNPVQNKIVKSYVDSAVSGSGGNIPVTPPSNPSAGQMYYDSDNRAMKFWDGTRWKVVADRDSIIVRNNVSPSSETDCTVSDTTVVLYRKYSTGHFYEVMISGFVSQSSATSYFHYPSGLTMWLPSDSSGTAPVITLTVENSTPDKSIIGAASCGGSSVTIETYDNDGESRRTGKYYFIIRGTCTINTAQADWL